MTACGHLKQYGIDLAAGFLAALQFLTILPTRRVFSEVQLGHSLVYFPLVGLGIGGLLYGLDRLFLMFLPLPVGSALLIVVLVLVTGAIHLDGFIDTCDGMAAGRSKEQRLEIMRDSHAGSFGVVGVCCLLLLKYVSLLFLPGAARTAAILLMAVMGRWAMVYALSAYRAARSHGLGRAYHGQAGWWRLAIATVIAVAIAAGMMGIWGLAVVVAVWLVVLLLAGFLKRKLGGLTGDTYGAIGEVTEVTTLVLVPLIGGGYF